MDVKLYHDPKKYSTLINGISIQSNTDGKTYFLCGDTDLDSHKEYFTDLLSQHGVTPRFIRVNTGDVVETRLIQNELSGGLRCQTNIINKNFLEEDDIYNI